MAWYLYFYKYSHLYKMPRYVEPIWILGYHTTILHWMCYISTQHVSVPWNLYKMKENLIIWLKTQSVRGAVDLYERRDALFSVKKKCFLKSYVCKFEVLAQQVLSGEYANYVLSLRKIWCRDNPKKNLAFLCLPNFLCLCWPHANFKY